MTINDGLFLLMCFIYLKLFVEFMASLAPQPKRRKRGGRWSEDESRGK